mmetsp:Transcript_115405/g.326172  ORF Transcript_115405/g.326172 Transcript_115405/m.326172 type:complete len:83 (-) Transcript_115405:1107-1355(-)
MLLSGMWTENSPCELFNMDAHAMVGRAAPGVVHERLRAAGYDAPIAKVLRAKVAADTCKVRSPCLEQDVWTDADGRGIRVPG